PARTSPRSRAFTGGKERLFKTTSERYQAVEAAIRELHSYELPAIHSFTFEHVYAPYAAGIEINSAGEYERRTRPSVRSSCELGALESRHATLVRPVRYARPEWRLTVRLWSTRILVLTRFEDVVAASRRTLDDAAPSGPGWLGNRDVIGATLKIIIC